MAQRLSVFVNVLVFAATAAFAQAPAPSPKQPLEVVKRFWTLETAGKRLMPGGWRETASFFVRPSPPPREKVIHVVWHDSVAENSRGRTAHRAEVYAAFVNLGRLDSSLRFVQAPERTVDGSLIGVTMEKFVVVLTDKYWEVGADGRLKEAAGAEEWRIQESPPDLYITVEAAIRYVTQEREQAKDPVVKKNANRTLAALKRVRPAPRP
jgi:hypothetical protein